MACAAPQSDAPLSVTGTVRFLDLEGGVYVIQADDSTRYQPLELSQPFRKDGLRVKATLAPAPHVMSAAQAGTLVEVIDISADTTG